MSREMRPENDNQPPQPGERREKTIAVVLVTMDILNLQLAGVQKVLEAHGVGHAVRDAVAEHLRPSVELLSNLEHDVIEFARSVRDPPTALFDALVADVAEYAEAFAGVALTPAQVKLADDFRGFVGRVGEAWSPDALPFAEEVHEPGVVKEIKPDPPANDNRKSRGR